MDEPKNSKTWCLIVISTFAMPMSIMYWDSVWLEFFDHVLVFVWGYVSVWNYRIGLGLVGGRAFDSLALVTLTVTWIVLGLGLAMNIRHTIMNPEDSGIGLWIACAVLVFQTILPIIVFSLAIAPSYYIHYIIPIPVPSILAVWSHAILYLDSAGASAD
ncbi:MAG: hypothetical protein ACTSV9_08305 [Candidatus Thorarchaeota archaeon]